MTSLFCVWLYLTLFSLLLWQNHTQIMTTPTKMKSRMAIATPRADPMAVQLSNEPSPMLFGVWESEHMHGVHVAEILPSRQSHDCGMFVVGVLVAGMLVTLIAELTIQNEKESLYFYDVILTTINSSVFFTSLKIF